VTELTREQIVGQIKDIDLQLGDPDRRGPDGERLQDGEYWAWRKKATAAKRVLEHKLSVINSERRAAGGSFNEEVLTRLDRIIELMEFRLAERD
jgi:hypothetical protein